MPSTPTTCLVLALAAAVRAWAGAGDGQRPRRAVGAPDEAVASDPLFFELAAATGGDFYFWTPGEFATTTVLPLSGDALLAVAHGELGARREIAFPVEPGLDSLSVFSGVQRRAELELVGPDGRRIAGTEQTVTLQRTRLMLLAVVRDPAPGTWTVLLGGSGRYSVSARATKGSDGEALTFLGMEHVELRGRPGHEGLFPVREPVPAGGTATCRVSITGATGELAVDYVGGDGAPLDLVAERQDGADVDDGSWLGRCPVPAVPHRVRIRGRDTGGHPFQRVEAALREPAGP